MYEVNYNRLIRESLKSELGSILQNTRSYLGKAIENIKIHMDMGCVFQLWIAFYARHFPIKHCNECSSETSVSFIFLLVRFIPMILETKLGRFGCDFFVIRWID
jgi:hypothetical protein